MSKLERYLLQGNMIAHRTVAGHSKTLADVSEHLIRGSGASYSSRTARDQHQPASSRAIAALATTERFLRASKACQRACRR